MFIMRIICSTRMKCLTKQFLNLDLGFKRLVFLYFCLVFLCSSEMCKCRVARFLSTSFHVHVVNYEI